MGKPVAGIRACESCLTISRTGRRDALCALGIDHAQNTGYDFIRRRLIERLHVSRRARMRPSGFFLQKPHGVRCYATQQFAQGITPPLRLLRRTRGKAVGCHGDLHLCPDVQMQRFEHLGRDRHDGRAALAPDTDA